MGVCPARPVSALFAETIDWFVPGSEKLSWAGKRNSPADVLAFFETMWSQFDTPQSVSVVDTLVISGDHAVATGSFTHNVKTTGKTFFNPFAMHMRVSGGKIVYLHLYEDTLAFARAFDVA